jgi:valyl-tRNA synthetase
MPFITEEIWQHIPHQGETITLAEYPAYQERFADQRSAREMELLMEMIRAVRNVRAEMNVPPSRPVTIIVKPANSEAEALIRRGEAYIKRFCNPESLTIDQTAATPEKSVTAVVTGAEMYLPLAGLIDIEAEIARLEKELKHLDSEVERVEKKLANQGFVAKAPAEVIEAERAKGRDYTEKRDKVKARITELRG